MYGDLDLKARDMILYFYQKHFPDRDGLVWPYERVSIQTDYNQLVRLFNGRNYKEDYQILLHAVRACGCTVPPLINSYMNLTPTMRSFGTCPNHHLKGTTDTGILITLGDLFPDKRKRYLFTVLHCTDGTDFTTQGYYYDKPLPKDEFEARLVTKQYNK